MTRQQVAAPAPLRHRLCKGSYRCPSRPPSLTTVRPLHRLPASFLRISVLSPGPNLSQVVPGPPRRVVDATGWPPPVTPIEASSQSDEGVSSLHFRPLPRLHCRHEVPALGVLCKDVLNGRLSTPNAEDTLGVNVSPMFQALVLGVSPLGRRRDDQESLVESSQWTPEDVASAACPDDLLPFIGWPVQMELLGRRKVLDRSRRDFDSNNSHCLAVGPCLGVCGVVLCDFVVCREVESAGGVLGK